MPQIATTWIDLDDDTEASEHYRHVHIPEVVAKLGSTARNASPDEDDVFKEVAGIEGQYMTLYDLPEITDAEDVDAQIQPASKNLPKYAKIDTRIYDEFALWHGEQWRGHVPDIQMFIIVLWQPLDAVHDEFVEWMRNDFVPGMLESPELLRARIFKLQHASKFQEGKKEIRSPAKMYQYMTVWEFDCEGLPWEIMVYLGSSEGWRHYVDGGHLQWQMRQYHVDQLYPEHEEQEPPAVQ